ncbi:EF-hand domain-containing protein [Phenylobacterium sp.]|uniref:EF-hand domain-containing protein n=1 Tax=Phenylobacterium sp. TaxID=1871053 RepID=UPI002DE47216|nr:EF-hand domain-containing protein [Phenylobacterium sp.]
MRPPKKSETLEVRLPYPTKQAFMARCRDDGRSASEAVRAFIETEVGERPRSGRQRLLARLTAGALLAAAAGAVAAPTLAHPNRTAEFQRLDVNHDGVLTLQEFRAR